MPVWPDRTPVIGRLEKLKAKRAKPLRRDSACSNFARTEVTGKRRRRQAMSPRGTRLAGWCEYGVQFRLFQNWMHLRSLRRDEQPQATTNDAVYLWRNSREPNHRPLPLPSRPVWPPLSIKASPCTPRVLIPFPPPFPSFSLHSGNDNGCWCRSKQRVHLGLCPPHRPQQEVAQQQEVSMTFSLTF